MTSENSAAQNMDEADAPDVGSESVESDVNRRIDLYHSQVIGGLMGPVREYYESEGISEIMINGPKQIYIEQGGKLTLTGKEFRSERDLQSLARSILQFVGKRLTPDELSVEARMPDGSRVHVVQSPAARPGLSIAIRKFPANRITMRKLVDDFRSFPLQAEEFLQVAMDKKMNIIVSGGTGSGKTTLLNALSELVDPADRVIIIEDATEIQFAEQAHVLQFETVKPDREGKGGIDIRELLRASLRMRPDRVIVGECRSGEAIDMVQAMNTGHAGSMSTVHSNSPIDCLARLETLCLMSEVAIPLVALQRQLASAIDVIVQISRHKGIRRVTEISEVVGFDIKEGMYELQPLFTLQPVESGPGGLLLTWTGAKPILGAAVEDYGAPLAEAWAKATSP
ncbi:MAG: CpaF family protein [Paracoccaceae bacterium]